MATVATLYVIDNCPGCRLVKARITAQDAVRVVNVTRDGPDQKAFLKMGYKAVPVLVKDGEAYTKPDLILRALGKA